MLVEDRNPNVKYSMQLITLNDNESQVIDLAYYRIGRTQNSLTVELYVVEARNLDEIETKHPFPMFKDKPAAEYPDFDSNIRLVCEVKVSEMKATPSILWQDDSNRTLFVFQPNSRQCLRVSCEECLQDLFFTDSDEISKMESHMVLNTAYILGQGLMLNGMQMLQSSETGFQLYELQTKQSNHMFSQDQLTNTNGVPSFLKSTDILQKLEGNQQIQIKPSVQNFGDDMVRKEFKKFSKDLLESSVAKYSKLDEALAQKLKILEQSKQEFTKLQEWYVGEYLPQVT